MTVLKPVSHVYLPVFLPLRPPPPFMHFLFVKLQAVPMRFPLTRVRLDGSIPEADHKRVEALCKSNTDNPMTCDMVHLGFKFPVDGGA